MDFDSVFKLLEYAGTCMMEVSDNIHVTIGWRFGEDRYFTVGQV